MILFDLQNKKYFYDIRTKMTNKYKSKS